MRGKNVWVGIVIILLIVGAVFMNQSREGQQQTAKVVEPDRDVKPQEGFAAPDFTLQSLSGETVQLYENNGKPSLINFWASWCPPCKVEMPDLQEAYDTYGDQVNFLMVDLTFNDDLDEMTQYIESNSFTFPVLLDETGDTASQYQVVAIPSTYIVDKNGIIVSKVQGAMSREQIQDTMKRLTK
ncbi:TlpA family protein disulfide reductase [Novibacillus thermophilus]|uniref:Thioredoxin domain-containing protein n=1 Tax=Novibacillus thermophilus TaxID=1471761 RepID=A0A1U9K6R2_9BACL|nr:TlpA disulfide reductase family protein [Novibacillus thermophilus]AQS55724.1 hypothetical protein B0W44_07885 [Novibacillus thermophilus]